MNPLRYKSGRSVLMLLAITLASSGALRLGNGVGAAMAKSKDTEVVNAAAVDPAMCPEPPLALAQALTAREQKVLAREAAVEERLAAMDLAETVITKRLDEMEKSESELKATLALADGAAENDLAQLTSVYEAMKPADAVKLFGAMAPEFAAGFLGRMSPAAAAAILAGIEPKQGYEISALLAGRNALAPTE